jgi:hypothetical protein
MAGEMENGEQHGASAVRGEGTTVTKLAKSSRKKHRGSGKGVTEGEQEQFLSLPLVYEHLEKDGLEEHNGH